MAHSISKARARWGYFLSRCYHEGLSKAAISRMVGRDRGLSAERSYTFGVLPKAAVRGFFAHCVVIYMDQYAQWRSSLASCGL